MSKQKVLGTGLEQRVVERATKRNLSAKKQPGSGVYKTHPSDVVVQQGLIECKVRSAEIDAQGHRYIRLDLDWLPKVKGEAERMGFEWAAVVANPKSSKSPLVLIDLDFFLGLLERKQGTG